MSSHATAPDAQRPIFSTARHPHALTSATAAPSEEVQPATSPPVESTSVDADLLAILDAPLPPWESMAAGFRRKETELGTAFATLTIDEARALHGRLSAAAAGDVLATKFTRLNAERRGRLLAFLAGAPRREAHAAARR